VDDGRAAEFALHPAVATSFDPPELIPTTFDRGNDHRVASEDAADDGSGVVQGSCVVGQARPIWPSPGRVFSFGPMIEKGPSIEPLHHFIVCTTVSILPPPDGISLACNDYARRVIPINCPCIDLYTFISVTHDVMM
jgi:hypothetical protein